MTAGRRSHSYRHRPQHQGPPQVIDVFAPDAFLSRTGAPAAGSVDEPARGPRTAADHGRRALVVAVTGEWAADVVTAIHLESRAATYVIPPEEQDLLLAVATARALSDPLVIWLPERPRSATDVQDLYDARVPLPGPDGGLIVRLGARAAPGVEEAIRALGLWGQYRTVPAETAADAATGLIYAVGLTR